LVVFNLQEVHFSSLSSSSCLVGLQRPWTDSSSTSLTSLSVLVRSLPALLTSHRLTCFSSQAPSSSLRKNMTSPLATANGSQSSPTQCSTTSGRTSRWLLRRSWSGFVFSSLLFRSPHGLPAFPQLYTAIFARSTLKSSMKDLATHRIKTGFDGEVGNKVRFSSLSSFARIHMSLLRRAHSSSASSSTTPLTASSMLTSPPVKDGKTTAYATSLPFSMASSSQQRRRTLETLTAAEDLGRRCKTAKLFSSLVRPSFSSFPR
jgi:hypothetical protein